MARPKTALKAFLGGQFVSRDGKHCGVQRGGDVCLQHQQEPSGCSHLAEIATTNLTGQLEHARHKDDSFTFQVFPLLSKHCQWALYQKNTWIVP